MVVCCLLLSTVSPLRFVDFAQILLEYSRNEQVGHRYDSLQARKESGLENAPPSADDSADYLMMLSRIIQQIFVIEVIVTKITRALITDHV